MDALDAISNNIWLIFLFFSIIAPRLQQTTRERTRAAALIGIGKKRGSNVITLIHRQETLSLFGLPLAKYIDIEDSENVLRAIRLTPDDEAIDIILHTPGGIALAATQIAYALKDHKGRTGVIVPHYAMSGGTLIALAADEIIMDPHAVLGPVDPQLGTRTGTFAAGSILKVVQRKKLDELDDETLYLAEEAQKAQGQMKDTVRRLIGDKYSEEQTEHIISDLVLGKYTHDFPITAEGACDLLGECTHPELPREVYTLMNMYKMGRQQRPSVEYVPLTRRGRASA